MSSDPISHSPDEEKNPSDIEKSTHEGEERGISSPFQPDNQLTDDESQFEEDEFSEVTRNGTSDTGLDLPQEVIEAGDETDEQDIDISRPENENIPVGAPLDTEKEEEGTDSSEFFAAYTSPGWYNAESEMQTKTRSGDAEEGEEANLITGDTQPVVLRSEGPSENPPPESTSQTNRDPVESRVPPRKVGSDATRAMATTSAASHVPSINHSTPSLPAKPQNSAVIRTTAAKQGGGTFDMQRGLGCLLRISVVGIFMLVIIGLIGVSVLLFQYYRIAATLPPVDDLRQKAAQFETTRILDREGNVLYEILDPNAGRRSYVTLDKISPYLVAAVVATEDKGFYSHPGFDVTAIGRAFLQNYQGGETISGASTITQQLARMLLFSQDERSEISYTRKVREAILAAEITRRYTKDEILELYINEVYFGNFAYGIEAAAQTYFRTSADKLTLAQAAFLGGLIQAPSVYDIYTNRDVTLNRFEQVLFLMYEASQEQGCIYVSNNPQRICVDALIVADATNEIAAYSFQSPDIDITYPHWVTYIQSLLESQFDAQTIYRSGFDVHTTIDPTLQNLAEQTVLSQVSALADRNATNGALVAIRPNTGEILAMVGSADFYNENIDGQVNMAISPRQPGSSIKPLTYLVAFEKGWTPATLIWDVPSEFPPSGDPNDTRSPYKPVNYDDRFHGPVTARSALANSYNVPAVKTLDFVGIYDNPDTPGEDGFIPFAQRLGISTLTRSDYGLSLTLGGGEVTLLELTGAYATFANGGRRVPHIAITRITDFNDNVVYQYSPPNGEQVVRPEHAFLISSILSDNEARTPAFGPNSVLNLPFQAASKTGTTNDFRDNWTMGYTPDLAVGVWVGNADYTPMQNISGLTGAAPIWSAYMQEAAVRVSGGNPSPFIRPAGIVERIICAISGTEPSSKCPLQRSELFAADQPPQPKNQDLWKEVLIDTWTGLEVSSACDKFTDQKLAVNVNDPWAVRWLKQDANGKSWAENNGFSSPLFFVPKRKCTVEDPRPLLQFTSPRDGDQITQTPLEIFGQAGATADFEFYRLEYGLGNKPVKWELLKREGIPANESTKLHEWDLEELPAGEITLRLFISSIRDTYAELRIRLNLQVPTPTPTPTPTSTPTLTPTPTPTYTPTPTFTVTPTQTYTPTVTPTPQNTPVPSPTPIDPFWTQPPSPTP